MRALLPIVEGHSEVEAVPLLLRRLLERRGIFDLQIARPFRLPRNRVVRSEEELRRTLVQGERSRAGVQAVLLLLDADDDDAVALEEQLAERTRRLTQLPSLVVVAERELEGWFLGCKECFRGFRGIRPTANAPAEPERIRGAKERLSQNMDGSRRYVEVDDQPAFVDKMDLDTTEERCVSFRRLVHGLDRLLHEI